MNRQKIRRFLLISSMLMFPITLYYFSPAIIINAGLNGIVNGSFIVFVLLLLGSIFFGRLFCSFLCPAGGVQECLIAVNGKSCKKSWKYKVKYVIWSLWMLVVIVSYIYGNGIHEVDFLYQTEHGISVTGAAAYIIYYGILFILILVQQTNLRNSVFLGNS